jgi:drug/metabolite transporter (DMT)-like permease
MARPNTLTAILFAIAGTAIFSVNDVAMKFLSGGYALHQIVLIRALVGLVFLFAIITVSGAGWRQLLTRRPLDHLIRVSIVMVSNLTFFVGLNSMEFADGVAVAYISPVTMTLLSVVLLGEPVGIRRWAAVLVGMLGVVVMVRPGAGVIAPAALLVLFSAVLYGCGNLMTRRMRATESAVTLSFYVLMGFIGVSGAMYLWAGDGHLASDDPLWGLLFRAWVWPEPEDWPTFLATGLAVTTGGLMVAQAYRKAEVGLIAPFEYVGMPMAILWGVVVFGTWPDQVAWIGIALICGAGLYTLWRETARQKQAAGPVGIETGS